MEESRNDPINGDRTRTQLITKQALNQLHC
jgi:hypothetical protein